MSKSIRVRKTSVLAVDDRQRTTYERAGAAVPRPSFLPLFTRVRGKGVLGTSQRASLKLAHMGDAPGLPPDHATDSYSQERFYREGVLD
jgi:hypothetical protein